MEPFDWQRLLVGEDHPWHYVFEIMFRTVVMYFVLIVFFKITGKTGIRQLSAFDFILIIGLGSAAGDPMFMDDIPLLHTVAVFVTILTVYMGINKLTQRSHRADVLLEGETACVLQDGVLDHQKLMAEGLTLMQFYSELRNNGVSHLGQVRRTFIEISGETSVFFLEDDAVRPGLPIFPDVLKACEESIDKAGHHSCVRCGYTQAFDVPKAAHRCQNCGGEKWVESWTERRVA